MKIYIEVLVIIILILVVVVWALWMAISKYIYVRRYKENDKGQQGEDERQRLIREGLPNPGTREQFSRGAESVSVTDTPTESKESRDIQTTDVNNDGEDNDSTRKSSSINGKVSKPRRIRNPFRRGKK